MHETHKLTEARYFLEHLHATAQDPRAFRFELSAFLGAARSVLQYALLEAKSKTGGKPWYAQAMTSDPLLEFFKGKRDLNIHSAPVAPSTRMITYEADILRIEGEPGEDDTFIPYKHHTGSFHHRFVDWPTDEPVIQLVQRYVEALQTVVDDGIAKGFISG